MKNYLILLKMLMNSLFIFYFISCNNSIHKNNNVVNSKNSTNLNKIDLKNWKLYDSIEISTFTFYQQFILDEVSNKNSIYADVYVCEINIKSENKDTILIFAVQNHSFNKRELLREYKDYYDIKLFKNLKYQDKTICIPDSFFVSKYNKPTQYKFLIGEVKYWVD